MRFPILTGLALLFLFPTIAVCQPSQPPKYEIVVVEMLQTLKQIDTILQSIEDQLSAERAKPALKEAVQKFVEIRKKAEKMKQPDKAEKDKLASKYAKDFAKAIDNLKLQISRVLNIPKGSEALKELEPLRPQKKTKNGKEKKKEKDG